MKILFLTIGDETIASTRARVYGYLPFLKSRRFRYKVLSFTSKGKCRRVLEQKKDTLFQIILETIHKICIIVKLLILSINCDLVFIQKVVLPNAVLKLLKKINKNIIFDFDDAIYLYKDITHMLRGSKCVIVSNTLLKEIASKFNTAVYELISPVDVQNKIMPRANDSVTLGWTGSPETSGYLRALMPVFKDLKETYDNLNIEFMGIVENEELKSLGIKTLEWSIESEKKYLENIDIGIMPLENDEWSQSKAGYKLLLYMSKGVSCVASPVGINKEIIEEGTNGFFADKPNDWSDKISRLITDPGLRLRFGKEAHEITRKKYSYEVNVPKFVNILEKTLNKT